MASTTQTAPTEEVAARKRDFVINDFSIQVATVNGSGSQSSNNVLMRAIFQMGVPVSGKNLFPSNIAGLPTWFTIRANKDGWIARKKEIDFLVAMNPETAREDVLSLAPGAVVVYEEGLKLDQTRNDLVFYPVPFAQLASEVTKESKLKKLLANMVYVGVVAQLLSIETEEVKKAIRRQFKSKPKAAELNFNAVDAGFNYAETHLRKRDRFRIERMNKTKGKVIIDGNSAAAIGCVFAGVTVATWYPITPSSSLCEALIDYLARYRTDKETGKATYAVIQAEDELAALGMVMGAGWAGARAMTSTSGPGISLMAEFAGLGYFTEVPAVIFDIQRVGPSTGLPTRTSQGDVLATVYLSHGDTRHIVLFPASVEECYSMAIEAFDLAERLQTPVFVCSDLDIGMNNWMAEPFPYPDKPIDRGKVLSAEELEKLGKFERYRDVDGDGVTYRTLPGDPHPLAAYFTRGSGHNEKGQYTERPEDYKNLMDRLLKKYNTARKVVPAPVIQSNGKNAEIGIIAFGSSDWAVEESRHQLLTEQSTDTDYLRIRALPFNGQIRQFVKNHNRIYVVEQNRDGQMADLIKLEVGGDCTKIRSVLHYNGLPVDARSVTDEILRQEKGN
ncbi:MAG TPA: 2-oxoacid:acceptor oxidoreductase subunit alpha [Acidobacteriota bacterium]|nr:2-oxoacid:acceptor oxidoreductase subunit alpha [Acidobacteriota bacterium]